MADQKITQLAAKTTIATTDLFPIVDMSGTPETKYITKANLFNEIVVTGGMTLTGDISWNTSGRILALAATAASPAFSFSDDTGMGIYRVSSGVIGFATAGALRATLRSTGIGIGIGTSEPAGAIEARNTGTQGVFSYNSSNSLGIAVNSSGNATLTPTGTTVTVASSLAVSLALSVTGATTFRSGTTLITTAASGYSVISYNDSANGGQNAFTAAGGTEGSPTATVNGQVLGAFSFRGYTGSAFTGSKAFINAQAAETWTPTANGTRLQFSVTPIGSTTLTEAMRIQNDGSISIGTSSLEASAKLNLVSTTQGFLPPRQTTTQRNAISSPANGLIIVNTTLNTHDLYDGTAWDSIVVTAKAQTLTNKRITPRSSTAASGDITPALATANVWQRTAISAGIAINAPTGTPVLGEVLVFMLEDDGTSRALTWNAAFTTAVMGDALPTATVIGKQLLVTAQFNGTTWLALSVSEV